MTIPATRNIIAKRWLPGEFGCALHTKRQGFYYDRLGVFAAYYDTIFNSNSKALMVGVTVVFNYY